MSYKIHHPFMIKALKKLGIEGTFFNQVIYDNHTNIILNREKLKPFPLKSKTRDKDVCSPHTYSVQYWISYQSNKTGGRNIRDSIGKEEFKLSLFVVDMILYPKDPKYSSRKLLDLINTFSKVVGYKINIKNLHHF
jgi:hypothetical protein